MGGKFFADKVRGLDGVVAHFEELVRANRDAFYPPDRNRAVDALRTDMSVVMLDGSPYSSLVSAHYLAGLGPDDVIRLDRVGPAFRELGMTIGSVAATLLDADEILSHGPAPVPQFIWFDADSVETLRRMFGGGLHPALSASLLTIHCVARTAHRSAARSVCSRCATAAQKHRFVALFQCLHALQILRKELGDAPLSAKLLAFLDAPTSLWVLKMARLRNGLVHLGFHDIVSVLAPGSSLNEVVETYTGEHSKVVHDRVDEHLTEFIDVMSDYIITPPRNGKTFLETLQPAV